MFASPNDVKQAVTIEIEEFCELDGENHQIVHTKLVLFPFLGYAYVRLLDLGRWGCFVCYVFG